MSEKNECEHKAIMENIDTIKVYSGSPPVICEGCGQDISAIVQKRKFNEATKSWRQNSNPKRNLNRED